MVVPTLENSDSFLKPKDHATAKKTVSIHRKEPVHKLEGTPQIL